MFRQELIGKKPDLLRKNSPAHKRKSSTTGPDGPPASRLLSLQRTIGNRAVQEVFTAGAMRTGSRSIQTIRGNSGVGEVSPVTAKQSAAAFEASRPAPPACSLGNDESGMKTVLTASAPPSYYGASFNHTFPSVPHGCSLSGIVVSEVVTPVRDDFRTGGFGVPLGMKTWILTRENRLNEPDRIWTRAGPRGIGMNPLRTFPAVLDQNQVWYYRMPGKGSWTVGPGIILNTTLDGDINRREALTVTTTDHGVSRKEPYRGPDIRVG